MTNTAPKALNLGSSEAILRQQEAMGRDPWSSVSPVWASLADKVRAERFGLAADFATRTSSAVYANAGPRGATDPKDLVARPNAAGVWEV